MSLYYNLLDEQVHLLKEKGYEESAISSPDKQGCLFTQLQRGFSDALHQSLREGEAVSFQIATTGFFNDDRDIVHFKFGYEFDPDTNSLVMTNIELVASRHLRKNIKVQSPQDVPHSSQALALLREFQQQRAVRYTPPHDQRPGKGIR